MDRSLPIARRIEEALRDKEIVIDIKQRKILTSDKEQEIYL